MRLPVFVLACAVSAAAGPALACSYNDYNPYEGDLRSAAVSAYEKAATIDWIEIEHTPPPCGRPSLRRADEEDEGELVGEACFKANVSAGDADRSSARPFVAVVKERLKGSSVARYTLMLPFAGSTGGMFTDQRMHPADGHYSVALAEKVRADSRHEGIAFWDRAELGPFSDGMDSCGGSPTLDVRMSYLAYRDASQRVIALEPVLHDDDALLRALRRGEGHTPPEAPVQAYFRTARQLLLVRVDRCRPGGDYQERVWARPLRGDDLPFRRVDYADDGSPVTLDEVDVDFLEDWFAAAGKRCRPGSQVLIVGDAFPAETPSPDRAWAAAAASPGPHAAEWGPALKEWSIEYRPVLVVDGRVRREALITGLRLSGPDSFTVDQAFAWFEEGKADRK